MLTSLGAGLADYEERSAFGRCNKIAPVLHSLWLTDRSAADEHDNFPANERLFTSRLSFLAKTCAPAGVSGLTFHDLRGSAVVRLALAEAPAPQIATITGHSLKDVEAILDAHYLGCDVQLAEAAVLKLEKRTKL